VIRLRALGGALAIVVVLAGCATVAPSAVRSTNETAAAFEASGRLSAKRGSEGVAAHFTWSHALLASPDAAILHLSELRRL